MILKYYNESYSCEKAVWDNSVIRLYDVNNHQILQIINVSPDEQKNIQLQNGEWSFPEDISSETDILRADLDYVMMLLDSSGESL